MFCQKRPSEMKTWANRNCVFARQSCKRIIRGQTLRSNCMKIENSAGASIQSPWHPYVTFFLYRVVREDTSYVRVLREKWRENVMTQSFLGFMTWGKKAKKWRVLHKFPHIRFWNACRKPCYISQVTQCIAIAQITLFYRSIKISAHAQLPPMPFCHSLLLISHTELEFCDVETPSVFCSLLCDLHLCFYLGGNRHSYLKKESKQGTYTTAHGTCDFKYVRKTTS